MAISLPLKLREVMALQWVEICKLLLFKYYCYYYYCCCNCV